MRKYRVICEWTDLTTEESDDDEIIVYANSASSAVGKARSAWRETMGAEWPQVVLKTAYVLTPDRLRGVV